MTDRHIVVLLIMMITIRMADKQKYCCRGKLLNRVEKRYQHDETDKNNNIYRRGRQEEDEHYMEYTVENLCTNQW